VSWSDWTDEQLRVVREAGRWRVTRSFDARGQRGLLHEAPGDPGRSVVSFASNDYLGLSEHPAVCAAAHEAIDRWGAGSTASRLIVGTRPVHHELEAELAAWKHAERALVFPTGFAANLGVLGSFGGPEVTVLSDELNHASIIDGCRLSRSRTLVHRHADVAHLDELLAGVTGRAIVVTDAVFSMDGDVAPLDAVAQVCVRHGALLVVDEAHWVLDVVAPQVPGLEMVRVGTLSKTLGALGGFVAGSGPMIDLLVNRARPFIFTTALSPADAGAALAAVRLLQSAEGDRLVARLRVLVDRVRPGHPSPVVPVVIGDERATLAAAAALLERGVLVPAIRPPTVPVGSSRLRVALSAAHTDDDIALLLHALAAEGLTP
jgi:8-amino-7-oxononanoate synthase